MKRALIPFLSLIVMAATLNASPESSFIDKIWKALESGKAESFIALYQPALPDTLEPTFEQLWQNPLDKGISSVAIVPFSAKQSEAENKALTIKGVTYVRPTPASAYLVITFKDEKKSTGLIPLSQEKGKYYLASWKVE
ncbi:hypothetical protein [Ruficoccus sp. ZRK36]|uniref:hypothetical protein n=1 Tax=Ruficoccus sp. ZRK36 TaxID=2866311 RepID=UPI001C72D9AF|nr:hypothetical protein [Ruficoccus sp. ZRK36]QYY36283.1 hypothetical protein K0V07_02175 [Ruficoccus sp. ZRK36]